MSRDPGHATAEVWGTSGASGERDVPPGVASYPCLFAGWRASCEGGLSPTTVGMSISKSLGTFWMFGSVKLTRPAVQRGTRKPCSVPPTKTPLHSNGHIKDESV